MAWTLKHTPASGPAVTKSFVAWGFNSLAFTSTSLEPGECEWHQPGVAVGGDLLFAKDDQIEVFDGEVRRFFGYILVEPLSYAQGNERGVRWIAHDVLALMAATPYAQEWQASTTLGEAVVAAYLAQLTMFKDPNRNSLSIVQQVQAIISHAASVCGFAIGWGGFAGGDATPFEEVAGNMTQLEALRTALKLVPDTCQRMDYTTNPPNIYFVRYASGTQVDITLPANAVAGEIRPRGDQALDGVVLQYKQTHTVDDEELTLITNDIAPPGHSPHARRTLMATFEFAGKQVINQKQYVGVSAIDEDEQSFWKKHVPWMKDLEEGFIIEDAEIVTVDEESTHTYTKYISSGACPEWKQEFCEPVVVTCVVTGVVDGKSIIRQKVQHQLMGARLTSGGVYSRVVSETPEEELPSNLATAIFGAASIRHFEGGFSFRANRPWAAAPRVGDRVNVPAKAAWAAMNAQVQSVRILADSGAVEISVGPPKHLGVQDVIEWFRRARRTQPGFAAQQRATGQVGSGSNVSGARHTPLSNTVIQPTVSNEAPWQLRPNGTIVPGTVQPATGTAAVPQIGGVPIAGGETVPTLTIPYSGILVGRLQFDVDFSDGWLTGTPVLESVDFAIMSSVPANAPTSGTFYRPFGFINDGVPSVPSYQKGTLNWSMCGNSQNNATLTLA